MATNPNDAVGTNAAYAGRTSPESFNDVLALFSGRGILSGWQCSPSNNMVVTLGGQGGIRDVAIAEDNAGNKTTIDNIAQEPVEVEIQAASTTSASTDYLVAYVNNPPEGTPLATDNSGACGLIDVRGSGASAPTEAQIRAAITADGGTGTTAYYVVLATIAIAAGTTAITAGNITQGVQAVISLDNLKCYDVDPTEDGILNIVDESLPSTPVNGMQFIVRPTATVANPKISLNGSTPSGGISVQHIGNNPSGNRPDMTQMISYNNYLIVYVGNYWRAINTPAKISASDADVASIMNSAGDNQQLFGLGGNVINMTNTNLNNYPTKTGFFRGYQGANIPSGFSNTSYSVIQIVYDTNYTVQILAPLYNYGAIFTRAKQNGAWAAWQSTSSYPTSAQVVGTWIDGKPVYRKVISTTTAAAVNTHKVLPGITNVATIIRYYGELDIDGTEARAVPLATPDNNVGMLWISLNKSTRLIQEAHNAGYINNKQLYLVVEYTRTTD